MRKRKKCKRCFENFYSEKGNTICTSCRVHKKCVMCSVITGGDALCDYCREHEMETQFTCCACGIDIPIDYSRWREHGAFCGNCLIKIQGRARMKKETDDGSS